MGGEQELVQKPHTETVLKTKTVFVREGIYWDMWKVRYGAEELAIFYTKKTANVRLNPKSIEFIITEEIMEDIENAT